MYVRVYVCVRQDFKGLFQGCIILFKETEAVKAALPQNWIKEAHIHTSSEKAIFTVCECTAYSTSPTRYTQPLALEHIPTALILILPVSSF